MIFTIVWLYFGSRKNWVATVSLVVAVLKVALQKSKLTDIFETLLSGFCFNLDNILLLLFSFKEVSFVNWKNHVRKIPYSLWNMFKNCKWGGMGIILDLMT